MHGLISIQGKRNAVFNDGRCYHDDFISIADDKHDL